MRQAQRKKEKDKVAVALILAFCVIALTSIFTIKSNIDKINGSNTNLPRSRQKTLRNPKQMSRKKQIKFPSKYLSSTAASLPEILRKNPLRFIVP